MKRPTGGQNFASLTDDEVAGIARSGRTLEAREAAALELDRRGGQQAASTTG